MNEVEKKAKEFKDLKIAQRQKIQTMLDVYFDQRTYELLSVKLGRAKINKLSESDLIDMFSSIKVEG